MAITSVVPRPSNSKKPNKAVMVFAGLCVTASVASIGKEMIPGQRLLLLCGGLGASAITLSQAKSTGGSWRRYILNALETIDQAEQRLVSAQTQLETSVLALEADRARAFQELELTKQELEKQNLEKARLLDQLEEGRKAQHEAQIERILMDVEAKERSLFDLKAAIEQQELGLREKEQEIASRIREANEQLEAKKDEIAAQTEESVKTQIETNTRDWQQLLASKEAEVRLWQQRYALGERPVLPRRRETLADVYCEDYIKYLWNHRSEGNLDPIKVDCDIELQPVLFPTHKVFWLKLRDISKLESRLAYLKTENFRTGIAFQNQTPLPYFVLENKMGLIRVEIPTESTDYKPPKEYLQKEDRKQVAAKLKASEPPKHHFRKFLEDSHQLGLLGATGDGKTELIKNIIAVYSDLLGGSGVQLIVINPKPSKDGLPAKYTNFKEAILGLFEAATEIAYRLKLNEQAVIAERDCPDHRPVIYFFDEFSQISSQCRKMSAATFGKRIEEFRPRLDPERLKVFDELIEDVTPATCLTSLLLFCLQVGRSEKVKILISGQNLMPATLGLHKVDLLNLGFICLGDTVRWGLDELVKGDTSELEKQYKLRLEACEEDPNQRFFGLYRAPRSLGYLALNPGMGEYRFDPSMIIRKSPAEIIEQESDSDELTELQQNILSYLQGKEPKTISQIRKNGRAFRGIPSIDIESALDSLVKASLVKVENELYSI